MKSEGNVSVRERARLVYLRSGKKKTLPAIAEELGVPLATVKTWKRRDDWDGDSDSKKDSKKRESESKGESAKKKKGGQPGNKNGLGNLGGGAPANNTNAVTTGEYARLLFTDLTPEEQALMAAMPQDTNALMRHDLGLLCVRERRMLARIDALQTGTQTPNTQDRIGNIEEGLTRLRREKQRIINALNDYEEKQRRNSQSNPFSASDAIQDSNKRMMTFADLLLHPAANRELSVLEGESSD